MNAMYIKEAALRQELKKITKQIKNKNLSENQAKTLFEQLEALANDADYATKETLFKKILKKQAKLYKILNNTD